MEGMRETPLTTLKPQPSSITPHPRLSSASSSSLLNLPYPQLPSRLPSLPMSAGYDSSDLATSTSTPSVKDILYNIDVVNIRQEHATSDFHKTGLDASDDPFVDHKPQYTMAPIMRRGEESSASSSWRNTIIGASFAFGSLFILILTWFYLSHRKEAAARDGDPRKMIGYLRRKNERNKWWTWCFHLRKGNKPNTPLPVLTEWHPGVPTSPIPFDDQWTLIRAEAGDIPIDYIVPPRALRLPS